MAHLPSRLGSHPAPAPSHMHRRASCLCRSDAWGAVHVRIQAWQPSGGSAGSLGCACMQPRVRKHSPHTPVTPVRLQAAADALAAATQLTALEVLRCVPSVPMNFFDFHSGVSFLRPMAQHLRRLKLNDARFLCHARDESWAPLSTLTSLESLVLSGALAACMAPSLHSPHAWHPLHTRRMHGPLSPLAACMAPRMHDTAPRGMQART